MKRFFSVYRWDGLRCLLIEGRGPPWIGLAPEGPILEEDEEETEEDEEQLELFGSEER